MRVTLKVKSQVSSNWQEGWESLGKMAWQVNHKKKKETWFFIIFIMTGSLSLGTFVEQEGYKAFISPRQPTPGEWKYFPGKILDYNNY